MISPAGRPGDDQDVAAGGHHLPPPGPLLMLTLPPDPRRLPLPTCRLIRAGRTNGSPDHLSPAAFVLFQAAAAEAVLGAAAPADVPQIMMLTPGRDFPIKIAI